MKDFNWGGFLIWHLPELPVAMDGRTNLHGDERLIQSLAVTWTGQPGWDADADLECARLVIADRKQPLTALLRLDPAFDSSWSTRMRWRPFSSGFERRMQEYPFRGKHPLR